MGNIKSKNDWLLEMDCMSYMFHDHSVVDLNKRQTFMDAAPGSNNPFRDSPSTAGAAGVIGSTRRLDIASQSGRWWRPIGQSHVWSSSFCVHLKISCTWSNAYIFQFYSFLHSFCLDCWSLKNKLITSCKLFAENGQSILHCDAFIILLYAICMNQN